MVVGLGFFWRLRSLAIRALLMNLKSRSGEFGRAAAAAAVGIAPVVVL